MRERLKLNSRGAWSTSTFLKRFTRNMSAKDTKYNRSAKGRARYLRYRASGKGGPTRSVSTRGTTSSMVAALRTKSGRAVPPLERPTKDGVRVALRGRRSSSPGPDDRFSVGHPAKREAAVPGKSRTRPSRPEARTISPGFPVLCRLISWLFLSGARRNPKGIASLPRVWPCEGRDPRRGVPLPRLVCPRKPATAARRRRSPGRLLRLPPRPDRSRAEWD
jgi:hypothetical protein